MLNYLIFKFNFINKNEEDEKFHRIVNIDQLIEALSFFFVYRCTQIFYISQVNCYVYFFF
jgi:hypothetical protein